SLRLNVLTILTIQRFNFVSVIGFTSRFRTVMMDMKVHQPNGWRAQQNFRQKSLRRVPLPVGSGRLRGRSMCRDMMPDPMHDGTVLRPKPARRRVEPAAEGSVGGEELNVRRLRLLGLV